MLDGHPADPVDAGSLDSGRESGGEGSLGEAEPAVDANGTRAVHGHDRVGEPVDPPRPELSAVALEVVEAADPVAVGLGDPDGPSDVYGDVGPGAVADKGPAGRLLYLVEGHVRHPGTVGDYGGTGAGRTLPP